MMSEDLSQPHRYTSIPTYTSDSSTIGSCNCTGKCKLFGYCPVTETAQQAINRLQAQIDYIHRINGRQEHE